MRVRSIIGNCGVTDPGTPTTNNTTQNFCLENNPKVADIQVNESNVVWYTTAAAGGFSTTAALTSGSYYGAIQDLATGCESAVRLVTVSVTDPGTPRTNDNTQDFCLEN
jgi:hypothetical protein